MSPSPDRDRHPFTDIEDRLVKRKLTRITWDDAAAGKRGGFPHFMLKEIHEQPQAILDTMRGRYSHDTGDADLPDIGLTLEQFAAIGRVWIVACLGPRAIPRWLANICWKEMVTYAGPGRYRQRVPLPRSAGREG